jgi:hypothetical protein
VLLRSYQLLNREGLRNKATNAAWCYRSLALLPHAPPSGAQQCELRLEHGLEGIDPRLGPVVRVAVAFPLVVIECDD